VVLKLVASCRWNCSLDELLTILEIKSLYRQLTIHVVVLNVYLYKSIYVLHSFFYYLLLSLIAINFIRRSPTGFVLSTLPLTPNKELGKDLLQALLYRDDANLSNKLLIKISYT
jgi:hypothetical protein